MYFSMKKILAILSGALLLLSACDKISPDQLTISNCNGTGGTNNGGGTWTNGAVQRVLVEKYTGPRCTNCPSADVTLDALHEQYGDKLVVIAINHPTGQGDPFPNQPDMRTEVGTTWDQWFGIDAIPAAYLNRNQETQYTSSMSTIGNDIKTVTEQDAAASVSLTVDTNGTELTITAAVQLYTAIGSELTLTLAVTEDSLVYKQSTPQGIENEYVHNHMLRGVITGTWGDIIPIADEAGAVRYGTYHFNLESLPIQKARNCHIVAFVSKKDDRTVLNCDEVSLKPFYK